MNSSFATDKLDLHFDPFPTIRLDEPAREPGSTGVRWLRFAADGAKRLMFPEPRHRLWVKALMLKMAVRAILFRNWNHDQGFRADASQDDVSPSEHAQRLIGTGEFASQFGSDALLGFTPSVGPQAVDDMADQLQMEIIRKYPVHLWPQQHREQMQHFMEEDLAGTKIGLDGYYASQSNEAPVRAQAVLAQLDELLLARFSTGTSIVDIQKALQGVLLVEREALARFNSDQNSLPGRLQEALIRIEEAHRQFNSTGDFARVIDAKNGDGVTFKLFKNCVEAHKAFHQIALLIRATDYAVNHYLPRLMREQEDLIRGFDQFCVDLLAVHEWAAVQEKTCVAANVPPDFKLNTVDIIVPDKIAATAAAIARDKIGLEAAAGLCCQGLVNAAKAVRLSGLAQLRKDFIREALLPLCEDKANERHRMLREQHPHLTPMLDTNIYAELRRLGGDSIDQRMRSNFELGLKTASPFLKLQENPLPLRLDATMGKGESPVRRLLVLLPEIEGEASFRQQLADTLVHATSLEMAFGKAEGDGSHNEARIISNAYHLPARFAEVVHELRRENPTESIPWHAWTFCHAPGSLPSLFLQNDREIKSDALPHLMILAAMGRLRIAGDEGRQQVEFIQPSAMGQGITDWEIPLGIPAVQAD